MHKYIRNIAIVVITILAVGITNAAVPERISIDAPKNILFVGNSLTYYNNSLHNMLRNLIRESDLGHGYPGLLRAMTISGAKLAQHAPAISAIVESEDWGVVVLQGHSEEAIDKDDIQVFRRAVRSFHEVIDEAGSETVLFMTWAPEDHADYISSLDTSYTFIGNYVNALVVPVGRAFERASREHPEIDLYHSDKKHPTMAGTYLAACTFFSAFYQKSAEGLGHPRSTSLNDTKAGDLQRVAWETVQSYYAGNDE